MEEQVTGQMAVVYATILSYQMKESSFLHFQQYFFFRENKVREKHLS